MISKNRIKDIHALGMKKNRDCRKQFVAEGPKVVGELLRTLPCIYIAATETWLAEHASEITLNGTPVCDEVSESELCKASFLQTPQQVIAIFEKPAECPFDSTLAALDICLALDGVQDPGNVGTILRLADWFGISHIICSPDTADVYSPKVVQATMGALGRIQVHKAELPALLSALPADIPIYGTFLNGKPLYQESLSPNGIIIMGNEGQGIRPATESLIRRRLFIPSWPEGRPTSESLNVAIATAIICAEFRRRQA